MRRSLLPPELAAINMQWGLEHNPIRENALAVGAGGATPYQEIERPLDDGDLCCDLTQSLDYRRLIVVRSGVVAVKAHTPSARLFLTISLMPQRLGIGSLADSIWT